MPRADLVSVGLAVTVVVMVGVRVWMGVGPRWAHLVSGPAAAALLVLVGRAAGLSWGELGFGGRDALVKGAWLAGGAAGLVAVAYGIGLLIPATRRAFLDDRYRLPAGTALCTALVAVPLATVIFEEVAFRGVLWGLVAHDRSALWATGVSSALFGLLHVVPDRRLRATGGRRLLLTVLGTVAFTALAGVVLAGLRQAGGGLPAPVGLHWATNGLGVLASAAAWAISRNPRE
jgi:membrane protease YdiL (CAAX protease family)